ncbi:MAG: type I pullulanase [Clostridiales bacterium]|nr:type I pullulanase [Clostridiales bacterium]
MTVAELKKYYKSKDFVDKYIYEGNDLGANYSPAGTVFKVWAPTATSVEVNLYSKGSDAEGASKLGTYPLQLEEGGVYVFDASQLGDIKNTYYTYSITVDGVTNETCDVYAKACGVNGQRSMVVDLVSTNPEGWNEDSKPDIDKRDAVIYELHIKDFSHDPKSGISEKNRGKYLAFTEKNTWLNGDETTGFPTCINYLKNLGVTYVHLLPSFDFGSIDESVESDDFNWGYDPMNYNVPEGSYSTNAFDGNVRIREYKEMVKALHEAGIGVVMDVVYNHTYNTENAFQKTVPYYYYRMNDDGTFSNGSACGNETCSEHEMYRKFMVDSVLYWAKEYHLDGFRFDLMGLHDTQTMAAIRNALNELPNGEKILVYGEPWIAGDNAIQDGYIHSTTANFEYFEEGIDIFSDNIRDAIKGSVFIAEEPGYINAPDEESIEFVEDLKEALTLPGRVAYVSAHDNFTLYDKLIMSTDYVCEDDDDAFTRNEMLAKMSMMAAGIVFTANGMAFFQAGEEFLRTKQGIGDSYKSPISINRLDWQRAYDNRDVVEYYKKLIKMRKKYKYLSNVDGKTRVKFLERLSDYENVVSFTVNNELLVVYNPNTVDIDISYVDKKNIIISQNGDNDTVAAKSVAVYEI